jgi:hypothetical protein
MGWPIVQTTYYLANRLTAEKNAALAAPTLFSAARCGLGQNIITPNAGTVYSDLDEGGYTGYAEPATIVWSALINETDGSVTTLSPSQLFRCTGSSSISINNFFINDGVGVSSVTNMGSSSTGILGSGQVVPAKGFANIGDGFGITIAWNSGVATLNCEATATS